MEQDSINVPQKKYKEVGSVGEEKTILIGIIRKGVIENIYYDFWRNHRIWIGYTYKVYTGFKISVKHIISVIRFLKFCIEEISFSCMVNLY